MQNNIELYRTIVEGLHEGVYFVDPDRRITYWNRGAERITGYAAAEVVGTKCEDNILVHVDEKGTELCKEKCPLLLTMEQKTPHTLDLIYLHHKEGHRVPVTITVFLARNQDGELVGAVEIFRERTSQDIDPRLLADLKKAALLNHLTGVFNRRYLEMNLASVFSEHRRFGPKFGILFIDIDLFKQVNDTYGHEVGDRVINLVAGTLSSSMRAYDVIGRWGGDEFLAIVRYVDEEQFRAAANKVRVLIQSSFLMLEEKKVAVTITAGAAYIRPEDTAETLFARADRLLYEGKGAGRNRIIFDS